MNNGRKYDSALLVAQIEPPQEGKGGDYYYRTHAPGVAMAGDESAYVINLANSHRNKTEIAETSDVLILKNICDPDYLPIIRNRTLSGKLTVFEIADDLSALEPWNPVYSFYKEIENQQLVWRMANACDALQFSCSELKRLYGHLNGNCAVFPNQVLAAPPERASDNRKTMVVGWGGSHGHLQDMAEIAAPLSDWINAGSNIVLHLMCSDPIWRLFDAVDKKKKKRFQTGSIEDYYRFLQQVDIGIAPLKDTPFNCSRSDVKFLEFAVSGAVPVMQKRLPYIESVDQGKTGFLFDDTDHLLSILTTIVERPEIRAEIPSAARRYVLEHRSQSNGSDQRLKFYRNRLSESHRHRSHPEAVSQLHARWSNLEGAIRKGRHLELTSTRFERLLYDGLVALQRHEDKTLARELFDEAASLEPGNYLPSLFGSQAVGDPVKYLTRAIDLRPDSLKAWILLGEEYSKQGKIKESLEAFGRAAEIYPDYDVPYTRASAVLEKIGENQEARTLSQRANRLTFPQPLQ